MEKPYRESRVVSSEAVVCERMSVWKTHVLLAALILPVLLIGLSGCSNNPYPAGSTSRSVLYRTIPDDPRSLDPSVASMVGDLQILSLTCSSYFRYHPLKRDPFVLELDLGAEQPKREPYIYHETKDGRKVTRHGVSWTFRIRKGLRFQDDPCFPGGKGREITAADFVYSLRRMADPAVPCPVLSYVEDKIIGLHEYAEFNRKRASSKLPADYKRPIEGLQLDPHDPYVFRVMLSRPYPLLRYMMAAQLTSPIPHEAPERYKSDFARHPVGCGPYVLAEYSPKLRVVLKKNPNRNRELYPSDGMPGDREAGLLKDAGKELPFADEVVFSILKESLTAWNLFMQGYLDWGNNFRCFDTTSVTQAMTPQGTLSKDMQDRGVKLLRAPNLIIWYFAFNMDDPVVGGYTPEKRKLRQAISLAINTQELIDLNLQGLATPAQFLIPPGVEGYDPKYRNPYSQYDLAKAKKLLAEAGYPGGISRKTGERLTIYFDNFLMGASGRQQVGLITKWFDAIGIRLESRSYRMAVWAEKITNHEYQFSMLDWLDAPDPENFALMLYGPNSAAKGCNIASYKSPEYDRLFERMQVLDDGPDRRQVIYRMRDVAVEDCPFIYLYHDDNLFLCNKWISNVKPHPTAADFVKYYRVDGPLRAKMQAEWNKPNYGPLIVAVVLFTGGTLPAVAVVRKRRNRRVRVRRGGTD